ncbi:hypothetical protein [Thalassotalea sp. PLHSN55]|uniref:hypothetical protein n=1 Tax=Thalassotalea sp. PLHSN55 TaxID=3435888 RepID=UPI003F849CCA
MVKLFLVSLIFMVNLFNINSSYAAKLLVCNSCETYMQAVNTASNVLKSSNKFSGNIFVGNIQDNVNYGFYVSPGGKGDEGEKSSGINIVSIPVNAYAQAEFSALSESQLYVLSRKAIDVPADSGFKSAWDIAQVPANRDLFDAWFEENHSFKYWSTWTASSFGSILFSPLAGIEIQFTFSDGSQIIMSAPMLANAVAKFTYLDNSASIDNNRIPDAGTEISGGYIFNDQAAMDEFVNAALTYGIEVSFNTSGGGTCPPGYVCYITVNDSQ